MGKILFKGNALETIGELPPIGQDAPIFTLVNAGLEDVSLSHYLGKKIILNIFPSIDTPTCGISVKKFNEQANQLENAVVLCISKDLPFAQKRFCGTENLSNVETLSCFRHAEFGEQYGVTITEGPLSGLLSRAIVVISEEGKIIHTEQVAELSEEPHYDAALKAV